MCVYIEIYMPSRAIIIINRKEIGCAFSNNHYLLFCLFIHLYILFVRILIQLTNWTGNIASNYIRRFFNSGSLIIYFDKIPNNCPYKFELIKKIRLSSCLDQIFEKYVFRLFLMVLFHNIKSKKSHKLSF